MKSGTALSVPLFVVEWEKSAGCMGRGILGKKSKRSGVAVSD